MLKIKTSKYNAHEVSEVIAKLVTSETIYKFAINAIYRGYEKIWTLIKSCFGSGTWINSSNWVNTETWKY